MLSGKRHNGASGVTKRQALKMVGAGAAVAASSVLLAPAIRAAARPIKIGFVTPQTGPLAAFAEPDDHVLSEFRTFLKNGVDIHGTRHPVEFIVKDSQSNPNRAAEVAAQLILTEKVDLITATATPDTTNPVADQAELNEVPCLTNDTPWQPHFFGRGGNPESGFEWTNHFFWGLEDIIAVYTNIWKGLETNKVVGALWPNDDDGRAWGDEKFGFPPVLAEKGYTYVDSGRFQGLTDDFSAQIRDFKDANCEIVTGVVLPPDLTTFLTQAAQQNFKPKIVTVGKASEFPAPIAALGELGIGLSVEIWWSPHHPFVSGLTGETSAELASKYTEATGRPWTMPLGFKHSLFEVAIDILRRTQDIDDPTSIRDAMAATDYPSIVGPINFQKGPVPNIAKTPLVGGQWQVTESGALDLVIVTNETAPMVPLGGKLKPIL